MKFNYAMAPGPNLTSPKPAEAKDEWNVIYGKEWRRVAAIGSGSFGSVYIGQRVEDQMVFAVKSVILAWPPADPRSKDYLFAYDSLRNEIMTLCAIRCKYVVRMLGCGRSDGKNSAVKLGSGGLPMLDMFLEYIPRGSLHHLMQRLQLGLTIAKSDLKSGFKNPVQAQRSRRLPEAYVRAYTTDILRAVDYLHNKQLVHGDIKCLNILMAEDCLKLADFGGCKSLKKKRLIDFQTLTTSHVAPEVYYKIEQGFASDIFSVGCCVLEMTAGNVPEPLFIPQWLSKDGQNFLRRCLTSDPSKRWTAAQLLEHPFIRDRDQNDLRPYSTAIPPLAERMILQPPPIEFYTNRILSPTYRGKRHWRDHATPQVVAAKVYGDKKDLFRKERIEISDPPAPPDPSASSQRKDKSPARSPATAAANATNAALITNNPAGPLPIKVEASVISASTDSTHQSTSEPSDYSGTPAALHPVQRRIAAADAEAEAAAAPSPAEKPAEAKNTPSAVAQPARKVHISSRPTSGPHDKDDDDDDQKEPDLPVKLPAYKPEFVPPDDNSLHFLLPEARPKEKGKGKYDDMDARAAAAMLKDGKNHKPLEITSRHQPHQAPHHPQSDQGEYAKPGNKDGYVTLLPRTISNLSQQDMKNFQEYNEDIKDEALLAEEAGIYDNKLCPDAAKTVSKRGRTPSFLRMVVRTLICAQAKSSGGDDSVYEPVRRHK